MVSLAKMGIEQLKARRMGLLDAGCALQSTDDLDIDGLYAAQDAEIDRQIKAVDDEIERRS